MQEKFLSNFFLRFCSKVDELSLIIDFLLNSLVKTIIVGFRRIDVLGFCPRSCKDCIFFLFFSFFLIHNYYWRAELSKLDIFLIRSHSFQWYECQCIFLKRHFIFKNLSRPSNDISFSFLDRFCRILAKAISIYKLPNLIR